MKHSVLLSSAFLATVLSASALAQVQPADSPPAQAQLTMAQAVVIAETMGNGPAVRVRLDEHPGTPVYRVTVQPRGETALKLRIAAHGGRIVASERVTRER